ncbi:MAG: hypothetical protein HWN66_10715 [Candidatus Helarchaeota archaeon]|nr:hypothetical protein [Candidatus Helarchaeota archaeon]
MSDLLERTKSHSFKEFTIFKGIIEGALQAFKQRFCIMDEIHWKSFYSSMYDLLGDSTNTILKKIGEDFGRKLFPAVQDKSETDPQTTFLFIIRNLEKLGWGAFWNAKIDEVSNKIVVEVHNSVEAYNEGIPSCYHVNGILKGIAKGVLGEDIIIRETKCTAKGDSNCEFVIGSKEVVPKPYNAETMGKLADIVQELKKTIKSSVELFATTDGVPILAPDLPEGLDPTLWGAIVSFLLAGGKSSSEAVNNGSLKEIIINSEQGTIVATQCTKDTLIAAVVGPATSAGLAGLAMKKARDKIIELLK